MNITPTGLAMPTSPKEEKDSTYLLFKKKYTANKRKKIKTGSDQTKVDTSVHCGGKQQNSMASS